MQQRQMLRLLAISISIGSLVFVGCKQQRRFGTEPQAEFNPGVRVLQRQLDVPYVPTPQPVVDAMLKLANVGKNDVIYDLGSGDGRIPITAAQRYGARGIGIEIDPQLVQEANRNAKTAGVSDRVQFSQQDLFQTDMSEATVVTLYLLTENNLKLRPKLLQELKPGTRIVSHNYGMGEWKPERVEQIDGRTIYLWTVPEKIPENLRSEFNIWKNLISKTEDRSDEGSKSYSHDEKISRTRGRFDDSPSHRCLRTTTNSTDPSDRD
nr:methyltransferase domain-containing protein [Chroococcidiopsis sp. [FACHB-1243]]